MNVISLKKSYYTIGIVAFLFVICVECVHFYFCLTHSPRSHLSRSQLAQEGPTLQMVRIQDPNGDSKRGSLDGLAKQRVQEEDEGLSREFYLSEITSFYGNMMTILFSTIGILLVIGFVYVNTISRGQAEDMAHEAIKEEAFQVILAEKIAKSLATLKSEGEIAEMLTKVADLDDKVSELESRTNFLEEATSTESYRIGNASTEETQGGQANGDNKAT
jgi:hypothetical protein